MVVLRIVVPAVILAAAMSVPGLGGAQPPAPSFHWPDGVRAAVSLSFDDARSSQIEAGLPLFERYGTPVTFYLTGRDIGDNAAAWRRAAASGHEMGNHTMVHPCTGNFAWARDRALEDYTLDRLRAELVESNRVIEQATGMKPVTFAYTCGQAFVGRGMRAASMVPLVSELFLAGRGWLGETSNDPGFAEAGGGRGDREWTLAGARRARHRSNARAAGDPRGDAPRAARLPRRAGAEGLGRHGGAHRHVCRGQAVDGCQAPASTRDHSSSNC
jgi:hypothetical protein